MHLTDFRYIFLLTYGRSGSTLLMKLLNAAEGVDIRGENHNTLFWLYKALDAALRARKQPGADAADVANPWYGAPDIDAERYAQAALTAFVEAVLRPVPGTAVTGFKEIRNTNKFMDGTEFAGYVDFILARFPDARIVFNTRDSEAVARSGWFRNMEHAKVVERIETSTAWFREAERRHDRCFLVDYSDVVENGERLAALFDFLDLPFNRERAAEILKVPLTHLKHGKARNGFGRIFTRR